MRRQLSHTRVYAIAIAIPLLLVVAIFCGLWAWSQSHAVLPGSQGCAWIRSTDARVSCLTTNFRNVEREQGFAAAVDDIERAGRHHENLAGDCHLAMHPIGERDGKASQGKGTAPRISDSQRTWCTSGYLHGFIAGQFSGTTVTAASAAQLLDSCVGRQSDADLTCAHGAGHAFVRASGSVRDAADYCVRWKPSTAAAARTGGNSVSLLAYDCQRGAFMEAVSSKLVAPKNACGKVRVVSRHDCYESLPMLVALRGAGWQEVAQACTTLATGRYQVDCAAGVGLGGATRDQCGALAGEKLRATCLAAIDMARKVG
jgi:hypothetical protein